MTLNGISGIKWVEMQEIYENNHLFIQHKAGKIYRTKGENKGVEVVRNRRFKGKN